METESRFIHQEVAVLAEASEAAKAAEASEAAKAAVAAEAAEAAAANFHPEFAFHIFSPTSITIRTMFYLRICLNIITKK